MSLAATTVSATRMDIRRVALDLFAERGYAGTSMRDLALAVGIRPASLYHHFLSKEDLLWDLTWQALEELEASRQDAMIGLENAGTRTRLSAFVRAHVTFHARFSQQAKLVNLNLSSLNADRYRQAREARDAYEERLRGILATGHERGDMHVPELRVTTYAVLQACTGVSTWFRPDGPLSIESLCDVYDELTARMVTR